jgi:hypothetical protein
MGRRRLRQAANSADSPLFDGSVIAGAAGSPGDLFARSLI